MPFSRPRATRAHGLTPLLTALICVSTHAGSQIDFRTHAGEKPIGAPQAQMQATKGLVRAESAEPESRYRWIGLRRAMPAYLAIRLRSAGAVVLGCAGRYPGGIVYTVDMGSRAGEALEVLRGSEAFIGVVSIDAADKTPPGLDTLGGLEYIDTAANVAKLTVRFHGGTPEERIRGILARVGADLIGLGYPAIAIVGLRLDRVSDLAAYPEVAGVGGYGEPEPVNYFSRNLSRVSELQQSHIEPVWPPTVDWLANTPYTGEGVTVCINEGGGSRHLNFYEIDPSTTPPDTLLRNGGGPRLIKGNDRRWGLSPSAFGVASICCRNG
jgi:hypothetical protein